MRFALSGLMPSVGYQSRREYAAARLQMEDLVPLPECRTPRGARRTIRSRSDGRAAARRHQSASAPLGWSWRRRYPPPPRICC